MMGLAWPPPLDTTKRWKLTPIWDILTLDPEVRGLADVERRVNSYPLTILDMKHPSEVFVETVKKLWG